MLVILIAVCALNDREGGVAMGHVLVGDCAGTDGGGVAMFWSVIVLEQTAVGWPCSGR